MSKLVEVSASDPESILIELVFPGAQELQRLKNDIVLSKAIDGAPRKYFINVVDSSSAPAYSLGTYIGDLYSKTWNEAIMKKCTDLDCVLLCDSIPGLIRSQDVLQRADLRKIFTFQAEKYTKTATIDLVDTRTFTDSIDRGVVNNPRVVFLDSHFQTDLVEFPRYQYVAVGGSFDNLHNGHRKLLLFAAALCSDELTIGITSDEMLVSKAFASLIATFEIRAQSVASYLSTVKPGLPLNIAKLSEPYGPAIVDSKLQALVVSSETIMGAFKINDIRRERGMLPLDILVLNRGDAAILSSSFIREQKAKVTSS
eukprot:gene37644-45729_t